MKAGELYRTGRANEIWSYYCGWIDLTLDEFMQIHRRLLMEQIGLLSACELGKTFIRGYVPSSVEEFRNVVPLTTYQDYVPFLADKREDALPVKPCTWIRTSGSSRQHGCNFKWAPVSSGRRKVSFRTGFGSFLFASCNRRGEFALRPGDRFLYCAAPRPYTSGETLIGMREQFPFNFLPPIEEAEKMSFQERVQSGFELATRDGLDVFGGLSSVLVTVGERFSQLSWKDGHRSKSVGLRSIPRLGRALVKSRLEKRPVLPQDIWTLKAIVTTGSDTAVYKERIKELWGRYPLNLYSSTEAGLVATQLWNYKGMCFVPGTNFYEFIPEAEHLRSREDPTYQPRTVLLDEVEPGQRYEIVSTGLRGACFVRYRIGDMIKIVAMRDDELGVDIPQMEFISRCDHIIDLAGFARLTEPVVWQALEDSGVPYSEWTAYKEPDAAGPVLRLCLEQSGDGVADEEQAGEAIHQALIVNDEDYGNMDGMLGLKPVRVTWLAPGTFHQYLEEKQSAGSDLGHLKPPHMQPSTETTAQLMRIHRSLSDGR